MFRILIVYVVLTSSSAFSYDLQLMEPKRIFVDAYRYDEGAHDPYLTPLDRELAYGGTFGVDFYFLRSNSLGIGIYWDNELHFDQARNSGQIKHGGWKYEMGLSLLERKGAPKIELFKQHWSRHIFEEERAAHFPVYDRYGIRFNIYP